MGLMQREIKQKKTKQAFPLWSFCYVCRYHQRQTAQRPNAVANASIRTGIRVIEA